MAVWRRRSATEGRKQITAVSRLDLRWLVCAAVSHSVVYISFSSFDSLAPNVESDDFTKFAPRLKKKKAQRS